MEPTEIIIVINKNVQTKWAEYYKNVTVGAHLATITNFTPAKEPWFYNLNMLSKFLKTIFR